MTRVDFYILPESETAPNSVVPVVCRLCEKAAAANQRIYVYAPDASLADDLDDALWTFRQGSFISHEQWVQGAALTAPLPAVLIGASAPPEAYQQVMVNLAADTPSFFSRFERVLEPIHGDARTRAAGRERYRYYRDRGYALATHPLKSDGDVQDRHAR